MRTNILIKTAVTAAAATLAISGCSDGSDDSQNGQTASSQTSTDFNQADVTYAKGMKMHHEQAVKMSDILLGKSGVDPDVEKLAKEIKKAQGPEIKDMESWLKDWGKDDSGHGGHGSDSGSEDEMSQMGHEGMVSPEDIKKLKAADGKKASTLFLDQMIEHHEGAVTMAEDHRKEGKNPEAVKLSENVITDQKAEIKEMRKMRASL